MTNSSNSGQTSGQLDLSLWLIRLIAYIIDGIIIFVVTLILRGYSSNSIGCNWLFPSFRWNLDYFWTLWITFNTILYHLGRCLGCNNRQKSHGFTSPNSERCENLFYSITYPQHQQNFLAFSPS